MSGPQDLRLADAERESAAGALGEHFAEGRLDSEEYDERVGRVWSARVRGDLAGLFDDLPGGPPPGLVVGPPAPPFTARDPRAASAQPRDHWVAGPSTWQQTGRAGARAVAAGASRLPTWLVVVAAIVLVPVVVGLVASALPFLLAGAIAWFFLAGPGSCGGRGHHGRPGGSRG